MTFPDKSGTCIAGLNLLENWPPIVLKTTRGYFCNLGPTLYCRDSHWRYQLWAIVKSEPSYSPQSSFERQRSMPWSIPYYVCAKAINVMRITTGWLETLDDCSESCLYAMSMILSAWVTVWFVPTTIIQVVLTLDLVHTLPWFILDPPI